MTRILMIGFLAVVAMGCQSPDNLPECTGNDTLCVGPNVCVDLATNTQNCGVCGNACGAGEICAAGECLLDCPRGQTSCPVYGDAGVQNRCVVLTTDPQNCGVCGLTCAASTPNCQSGVCTP